MTESFRLVVIGGGSGGLAAASFAARLGVLVALVERNCIGGDCTWTGCVPSKALLHAAAVAHTVRAAGQVGVRVPELEVDFGAVMASVRCAIDRVYRHETPEALASQGVTVVVGEARFVDPRTVEAGGRQIRGDRFLIATGAGPVIPSIPGLREVPYLTYETVFDLTTLPRRLLVLGAGPIGCELAQAFQRLGAAVTLVDHHDRALTMADPEASAILGRALAREGVRLRLGATVERVAAAGEGIRVEVGGESILADALLVAAGRRPRLAAVDLDRAGIKWSPQGIVVDEYLQTTRPHIYACGDAIGSFQFTHYAGWQGAMAVRNALLPGRSRGRRDTVPWTIFTDPEIAQVGLDEEQARQRFGATVRVTRWGIDRIDRAVAEGETEGFLKLIHRPNGALLGATLLCKRAGELAQELSVALTSGVRLGDLAGAIHVYPTYGFGLQQAAAEAVYDRLTSGAMGRVIRFFSRR
ncbi:MAG: FAD-dependent oxidoreductase [Chloroflexi bacterium]|nr:FAD-dependent oxidoreductase [Chloroflexota bacterium]